MPNSKQLSPAITDFLFGTPWGDVFPATPNPNPKSLDGRTVALKILKQYISELEFFRVGTSFEAPPIPFTVKLEDIYIEWPDNEDSMKFPSVVFLSDGRIEYDAIGLTGYIEEDSRDKYGLGTVVQWQSEPTETLVIEVQCTMRSERRALKAGLETALVPTEQMYGIRFRLADYYDQLVCFTLNEAEIIDGEDSAKGRRKLRLYLEMRYTQVALVRYTALTPDGASVKVDTDVDQDTNQAITPSDLQPSVDPIDPFLPRRPDE